MQHLCLHWYPHHYVFLHAHSLLTLIAYSLSISSEDWVSKIVGIYLAIGGFVIAGFEHCIANMFFVPLGLLYGAKASYGSNPLLTLPCLSFSLSCSYRREFLWHNLLPVTLGNITGAILCLTVPYFYIYYNSVFFPGGALPPHVGAKVAVSTPTSAASGANASASNESNNTRQRKGGKGKGQGSGDKAESHDPMTEVPLDTLESGDDLEKGHKA